MIPWGVSPAWSSFTSAWGFMSVENGPFGLSTTQTWSISGVPLLKEPAGQLPAASVKASMMFVFELKQRLEWACQSVSGPPMSGPAWPIRCAMYIAASRIGPLALLP